MAGLAFSAGPAYVPQRQPAGRSLPRTGRKARPSVEESPGSMEARWRLTAAEGDLRESATENKPPFRASAKRGKGETVR